MPPTRGAMDLVINPNRSAVVVARGPLAAEAELLRLVAELAARSADQLELPLRIVVPSGSLRRHLVARLAFDAHRPLVGVVVQTLQMAARETMERAGESVVPAGELTSILVRRRAGSDSVLGPALAGLEDGYGIVEGAVSDLLDAGFEPDHVGAVADKLAELDGQVTPDRLARAAGVLTVAAAVALELDARGVRRLEQLPQRAAGLLYARGPAALPSRAVLIHGFADATGVATDFIQALVSVVGGAVIIDRPPDPARLDEDDAGAVFVDRLEAHLGALTRVHARTAPSPTDLDAFFAASAEAEARQVAHRIRSLLDDGVRPEAIGVVAREIEQEAVALRRQFQRLSVPFSGVDATLPGGLTWRRARLLSAILRHGVDLPAELWLEALGHPAEQANLGLALRTLGVVSVADAAGLVDRLDSQRSIKLPFPDVEEGEPRRGRTLEAAEVIRLAQRAAALSGVLSAWPERARAADHLALLHNAIECLGWGDERENEEPVITALEGLAAELPADLELSRNEVVEAARRRLQEVGLDQVGGAGGGVQLLSAMEARARTFEHLFLIALNRGRFPRVVQDDALLPDTVRGHLAAEVLPEFPVKARGIDEERYLFAQLLASAGRVTLSWRVSEGGSRVAPSPFVERLRRELQLEPRSCPAPFGGGTEDLVPRTAFEHAVLAAGSAGRRDLASVLAEALAEGGRRAGLNVAGASELASARIDVIEAVDPRSTPDGPGPWAGLVGAAVERPGGPLPAVTGLEDVARCPWRAFAGRRLGVAGMPDPRLGLPDTRGMVLGSVVHQVLQAIVEAAVGRSEAGLEELVRSAGRDVPWPEPELLDRLVLAAAEAVAARNGLAPTGVAPLLAAQARPVLEVARSVDWSTGRARGVVAAEVSGEVTVAGGSAVRFRADRLDCSGDAVVLVDYKTGKPPSKAAGAETRRRHLLGEVARGRALQAVAYALAVPPPRRGEGRYLALRPDIGDAPEEARSTVATSDDDEMIAAFGRAVATIARGWQAGGLAPRVEEVHKPGKTPDACGYCPVVEACLRSDSGYRQRLVDWMSARAEPASEVERAACDLWWLGVEPPDEGGS